MQKAYEGGESFARLARRFGCSEGGARLHMRRRGVVSRPQGYQLKRTWKEQELAAMEKAYRRGDRLRDIARHFGCSLFVLRKQLALRGLTERPGSGGILVAWPESRLAAMEKAYRDGMSVREIVRRFGVGHSSVLNVMRTRGCPLRAQY
jgi:transposase-like protein